MISREKEAKYSFTSAMGLSLLIHLGLFLLAGAVVVFTLPGKAVTGFIPPRSIQRPKIPLRKLTMKRPRLSKPPSMVPLRESIAPGGMSRAQFPGALSSAMRDRLGAGSVVGFEGLPGLESMDGVLGSSQTIGNDLEGTFYDFKRNRSGSYTGAGNNTYKEKIRSFLHRDWKSSVLSGFYRSPRKIYTTMIVVPPCSSAVASLAFGEDDSLGRYWMIHYKGPLVHGEDLVFRFWGSGDEVLAVRVDGELVLAACWDTAQMETVGDLWQTHSVQSRRYYMGNNRAVVGDWVTLQAGIPREMEVLLGDNGGEACAMLAVEVKGVEYERNHQGGPILPAFKTAQPTRALLDVIYKDLPHGEICLTNGPVFCDY